MILYTIMPLHAVFGDGYNNFGGAYNNEYAGYPGKCTEINYLGEKVMVYPLENNRYVINRIFSTSPKAYLNPKLQPGRIINRNSYNEAGVKMKQE